jgi:hypothetical protein
MALFCAFVKDTLADLEDIEQKGQETELMRDGLVEQVQKFVKKQLVILTRNISNKLYPAVQDEATSDIESIASANVEARSIIRVIDQLILNYSSLRADPQTSQEDSMIYSIYLNDS